MGEAASHCGQRLRGWPQSFDDSSPCFLVVILPGGFVLLFNGCPLVSLCSTFGENGVSELFASLIDPFRKV